MGTSVAVMNMYCFPTMAAAQQEHYIIAWSARTSSLLTHWTGQHMSHFARTHGSPVACTSSNTLRHAPALQAAALYKLLRNRNLTCGLEKDNPVSNTVLLSGVPEMMSPALPPLHVEPAHHVRCRPDAISTSRVFLPLSGFWMHTVLYSWPVGHRLLV